MKLLSLLVCAAVLCSCSSNNSSYVDPGNIGAQTSEIQGDDTSVPKKKRSMPKVSDYHKGDISYKVTLSDAARSISLDVERRGGVTIARVTSPEELAGLTITDDAADGVRITTDYEGDEDIIMTDEGGTGFLCIAGIMSHKVSKDEFDGYGTFVFDSHGYSVELQIGENGFPERAKITRGGYVRELVVENIS